MALLVGLELFLRGVDDDDDDDGGKGIRINNAQMATVPTGA